MNKSKYYPCAKHVVDQDQSISRFVILTIWVSNKSPRTL